MNGLPNRRRPLALLWLALVVSPVLLSCSETTEPAPTWHPGDSVITPDSVEVDALTDAVGDAADEDATPTPDTQGGDSVDAVQPADTQSKTPKIVVKLKGTETTLLVFQPLRSQPKSPVKAAAEIFNMGDGPLVIADVGWQSDSLQLAIDWAWQEPFTFEDLPLTIEPGAKRSFLVTYDPNQPGDDQGTGRLTLKTNDPKKPDLELLFSTPCTGAKPLLQPQSHVFVNASPQTPQQVCIQLGNIGCEPFEVQGATIQPADDQYAIVQMPNSGSEIPQVGQAPNFADQLMKLQICVQFKPNGSKSPSPVELVVQVKQGVETRVAKAKLSATWQADSGFALTCDTGAHLFDFASAAKRSCTLENLGPAGLSVYTAGVVPVLESQQQDVLDKAFALQILIGAPVLLPVNIAAGSSTTFQLGFTAPAGNPPLPARLDLWWNQAGVPQKWAIPISAGTCKAPAPEFGPNPLGFHAPSGGKSRTAWIFNQSCSPLRLIKACTTLFNVTQDTPCETGAESAEYTATFEAKTVAPWGTTSIPVQFQPGASQSAPHYGILHVYWCAGEWTANACKGKTLITKVNLEGSSRADVTPPQLALQPVVGAQAGKVLRIKANVTPGTYPIGLVGAYQWTVTARPPGSAAWLYYPMTTGAELLFVPDRPGSYTISATVSAFSPGDLGSQTSSAPQSISFQVAY